MADPDKMRDEKRLSWGPTAHPDSSGTRSVAKNSPSELTAPLARVGVSSVSAGWAIGTAHAMAPQWQAQGRNSSAILTAGQYLASGFWEGRIAELRTRLSEISLNSYLFLGGREMLPASCSALPPGPQLERDRSPKALLAQLLPLQNSRGGTWLVPELLMLLRLSSRICVQRCDSDLHGEST